MLNSDTARERIITSTPAKNVLKEWFDILSEPEGRQNGKRINGRAWRAELRRMAPPYDVMMCDGYVALRQQLAEKMVLQPVDELALALFVSVAVHIKNHEDNLSFAAQLGEKIDDTPCLSSLRFERLQKAKEPEVFCQQLIRAVRIRGSKGVNIVSLADSIFIWMREWQEPTQKNVSPFERHHIRWANEYLSTAR
ncbi:type I-E CRISPR-associated protein Cse2/CasB [Erwinia oleae]|uniref:type I-E CRISPR-associated protein Cse2/CasB n=1 Tax=Erwinia oleae TaxID=796334 RepID=UPI000557146A|nr:type I-E CRISPR-associated protein Cse2/CasB [Erwinia oleae]